MRFLFDTNVLNKLLDQCVKSTDLIDGIDCFVTAAQVSEIKATKHNERRLALLACFKELEESIPIRSKSLESAPLGSSPFGQSPFGGGEGKLYEKIKNELDSIKGNNSRRGNTIDALTYEACVYLSGTLVTNDSSLTDIAKSHDVSVMSFDQFIKMNQNYSDHITYD